MSAQINVPQREAIHYMDGPCLVLAGAGSGKTRVITHKIAWLIERGGMSPENIAAITFTNKAAREMQERIATLMGGRTPKGLTVSTFHALGVRIIRQEAALCGLKPQFSILDSSDAVQIIADIAAEADRGVAKQIQWQISGWKNALVTPEQARSLADNELTQVAAALYAEYQRTLRAYQAVDFDDLLGVPVHLFENEPDALTRWRGKLRYILVDEYQDTNGAQYRLLKLLAAHRGAFTAVGDDDQAIYGWRGADIENLRLLQKDYPALRIIKLEQNYRSTRRILKAANTLIAHNNKLFDKKLWSEHGEGDRIRVHACRNPEHEAEWVATRIAAHYFQHRDSAQYRHYAVLYRGNHQARLIEQQLRTHNIPYAISGGQSFFDRAEIRDLCAYLRLLLNPDDDLAFIRSITVPRRGIGAATLEALGQYAAEHQISLFTAVIAPGLAEVLQTRQLDALRTYRTFVEKLAQQALKRSTASVLETLLEAIQYEKWFLEHFELREAESKWKNVRDFVDWLGRKGDEDGKNLLELTKTVTLMSMLDKDDPEFNGVQLATLHAAKGLEFPHVFLIGVEEGLLPHQTSVDEGKIEEERRLMYVGVTRAQRTLTISWCERRSQGRELRHCDPSRFIGELGGELEISGRNNGRQEMSREEGRNRAASLLAMLTQQDSTVKPR